MKQPIRNFRALDYPHGSVTQWFKEHPELYARFGLKGHNGIDIVDDYGAPIYAVEDGIVIVVQDDPAGYGKCVRIQSGNNEWVYAHASVNLVTLGEKVVAGQEIQKMGNTGFVLGRGFINPWWSKTPIADHGGTHLHLGLRKTKLDIHGFSYHNEPKHIVLNYDNGYKGSVNFREELENCSPVVVDLKKKQTLLIQLLTSFIYMFKR